MKGPTQRRGKHYRDFAFDSDLGSTFTTLLLNPYPLLDGGYHSWTMNGTLRTQSVVVYLLHVRSWGCAARAGVRSSRGFLECIFGGQQTSKGSRQITKAVERCLAAPPAAPPGTATNLLLLSLYYTT